MKVKIFEDFAKSGAEARLNEFCKRHKVIDIKLAINPHECMENVYTTMVLYEK